MWTNNSDSIERSRTVSGFTVFWDAIPFVFILLAFTATRLHLAAGYDVGFGITDSNVSYWSSAGYDAGRSTSLVSVSLSVELTISTSSVAEWCDVDSHPKVYRVGILSATSLRVFNANSPSTVPGAAPALWNAPKISPSLSKRSGDALLDTFFKR